jgi:hypothetical protein
VGCGGGAPGGGAESERKEGVEGGEGRGGGKGARLAHHKPLDRNACTGGHGHHGEIPTEAKTTIEPAAKAATADRLLPQNRALAPVSSRTHFRPETSYNCTPLVEQHPHLPTKREVPPKSGMRSWRCVNDLCAALAHKRAHVPVRPPRALSRMSRSISEPPPVVSMDWR